MCRHQGHKIDSVINIQDKMKGTNAKCAREQYVKLWNIIQAIMVKLKPMVDVLMSVQHGETLVWNCPAWPGLSTTGCASTATRRWPWLQILSCMLINKLILCPWCLYIPNCYNVVGVGGGVLVCHFLYKKSLMSCSMPSPSSIDPGLLKALLNRRLICPSSGNL